VKIKMSAREREREKKKKRVELYTNEGHKYPQRKRNLKRKRRIRRDEGGFSLDESRRWEGKGGKRGVPC
jgi:hypothetical protein